MKRSEINNAVEAAIACFEKNGWSLPPFPRWDVTDFGLGDFKKVGLVLVNLAEEAEYCEKLMYAVCNQETPLHYHKKKKEDIICRMGELVIELWSNNDLGIDLVKSFNLKLNGVMQSFPPGASIFLKAGERATITPGLWHRFYPKSTECIIGEVSTANDDLNDNFFDNPEVGRFSSIAENETPLVKLVSEL